jgi:hypothetical protein
VLLKTGLRPCTLLRFAVPNFNATISQLSSFLA